MSIKDLQKFFGPGVPVVLRLVLLLGITAGLIGATHVEASDVTASGGLAPAGLQSRGLAGDGGTDVGWPVLVTATAGAEAANPERDAVRAAHSEALMAFQHAERWVRDGDVEGHVGRPIWVRDVSAVRVELRWAVGGYPGLSMGTGTAFRPSGGDGVTDLTALTREAVREAMTEMQIRYRRAQEAGEQRLSREELGRRMMVDIQIAREPEPVVFQGVVDLRRIVETWASGFHGLIMERPLDDGRVLTSRVWPGTVLAGNITPEGQLLRVFSDVEIDVITREARQQAMESLIRPGGPRLSRFEVLHVVRPGMHLSPVGLVRGNAPVAASEITADMPTLASMASRMSDHLRQRVGEGGRISGLFQPSVDNVPEPAGAEDAATVIYALALRLDWMVRYDPDPEQVRRVRDMLRRQLEIFRSTFASQRSQVDLPTAGWMLLALSVTTEFPNHRQLRDELAATIIGRMTGRGRFTVAVAGEAEPVEIRPSMTALLASALAMHAAASGNEDSAAAAAELRERIWTELWPDTPFVRRVEMIPWLAKLEREAAGVATLRRQQLRVPAGSNAGSEDLRGGSTPMIELRGVLDRLVALQIRQLPGVGPGDVLGGLMLSEQSWASHAPAPDWRTSYLVMTASILLQIPDAVDLSRRDPWLVAAANGAGFLGQLMIDEHSCYYIRNRSAAMGGVRLSLVDNRLAPTITGMSLIAVSELQQAVRARRASRPERP